MYRVIIGDWTIIILGGFLGAQKTWLMNIFCTFNLIVTVKPKLLDHSCVKIILWYTRKRYIWLRSNYVCWYFCPVITWLFHLLLLWSFFQLLLTASWVTKQPILTPLSQKQWWCSWSSSLTLFKSETFIFSD